MREVLSSLVDIYLSNASIKMNEIMKVLTIISTIFIPLTFIVGLYGMNFKYMPEINWIYGYPMVLILMLSVAMGLIIYFKRKKWF
jgi:magnesium transporter